MRSLDLPQILYQPFAATGDKNTILNSPSTDDPQRANLQTGFPPITQIPIDNGGIPPERMDFNGLGYLLSSFYFFTQCGGVYTFNRNVSNAIGGYPLGAVLYYTDSNGTTYKVRSLLENNTFDFVTTPSYIDDEHWAYVSSTPITQDTSASSTSNVFSTAAVQSLLNTVVHKTGSETISGVKTFAGDGWITKIQNTDVTYNTAPSSDKGSSIIFTDKNGTQMGCVETMRYPSNNTLVRFNAYSANGNWASQALELMIDANGNTAAFAPASDAIGSIVTTTGINKAENGYVKLGNGLIVQWGKTPNIGNSGTTCTLPTPFTTTNYSVTAITSSAFNENCIALTGKTTTNFTLVERGLNGGAHNVPNYFLAIGY